MRPEDVQAIVAGLAANPNAMATMAHFITRATSTSDQPASSSARQGPSNSKLHATIITIRDKLWLTPPTLTAQLLPHTGVKYRMYRVEGMVEAT